DRELIALPNGNYVVTSPFVDSPGIADVGAVTWGSGTHGVHGPVATTNSLVGSTAGDMIGSFGISVLTNGNYVVDSPLWDGTFADVGATTWRRGTDGVGRTGVLAEAVSTSNSVVGQAMSDEVGFMPT